MNVIHIGSWKTATTTVQTYCRKNLKVLARNNICFIDQRSSAHSEGFQPQFRAAIRKIQKSGAEAEALESIKLFEYLHDPENGERFYHSWEGMLGHPFNSSSKQMYHPNATAKWLGLLSGRKDIQVVLTIRRQCDLVEAMYAQEVRKGRTSVGIDKFVCEHLPKDMSWAAVIQPLIDVLGKDRVRVIPYEWVGLSGNRFFNSVFEGVVPFSELNGKIHSNPSYSHLAVEISRLANLYITKKEVSKLEKFLAENFSNVTHRRAQFISRNLKQEIAEKFVRKDVEFFEREYSDLNLEGLGYFEE